MTVLNSQLDSGEKRQLAIVPSVNGQADPGPEAKPERAPLPLLISLDEMGALMGLSRDSISRYEQRGLIGPVRVKLGRKVCFVRAEVEAWVAARCPPRDRWTWKPDG